MDEKLEMQRIERDITYFMGKYKRMMRQAEYDNRFYRYGVGKKYNK